jgi:phosphatidylserine/phosphatidylglycerophosphate/cardiolipin synthase-like enzyme
VRVVLDAGTPTSAQQMAIDKLKAAGVSVVAVSTPTIHAKSIVADGARAYVGSMNFTYNSLNANREVGLITDATSEIAKITSAVNSDFAAGSAL